MEMFLMVKTFVEANPCSSVQVTARLVMTTSKRYITNTIGKSLQVWFKSVG